MTRFRAQELDGLSCNGCTCIGGVPLYCPDIWVRACTLNKFQLVNKQGLCPKSRVDDALVDRHGLRIQLGGLGIACSGINKC